jgi:hypothetical protein
MRLTKAIANTVISLSCVFGLVACSENSQALKASKSDVAAYQGAKNGFVDKNWTPGDKTSWEKQLRVRAQIQDEYTRSK